MKRASREPGKRKRSKQIRETGMKGEGQQATERNEREVKRRRKKRRLVSGHLCRARFDTRSAPPLSVKGRGWRRIRRIQRD